MDGITRITTEATTTHISMEGITTNIATTATTIGTGAGLSASVGVQDIIAIGKRIVPRSALTFAEIARVLCAELAAHLKSSALQKLELHLGSPG
jgi:hypothetical protein